MVQSPGDGSSRSLCLLQITTQVPSLGKLSRLGHLRRGGFVTCCGLRVLRALRDLGRWLGSPGRQQGVQPCATQTRRTPKTFFSALSCSLAPAQKVDGLPGPHFYSALSSRDA